MLLVLKDDDGNLQLLVHPEFRTIVREEDLDYIESVLDDFRERARSHPAELFLQVSSLGVGPLLTRETGLNLSDHPSMLEHASQFVEL
jgi:hypothetical protein